jgi:hypothetical protein
MPDLQSTFILENACSGILRLTTFPYTAGYVGIVSPFGTPIAIINLDADPSFTASNDVLEYTLPTDPTNGQVQTGTYAVTIVNEADHEASTEYSTLLPPAGKELAVAIIAHTQNCTADTATFNFTSNVPPTASPVSYEWTITDPNGTITTGSTNVLNSSWVSSGCCVVSCTCVPITP